MSLIQPFAGLRPAPGRAADLVAPPYDVLSREEAVRLAAGRPWSFLHISRPEIDLPAAIDPHVPAVYDQARASFARALDAGVLVRDPRPAYYLYRLSCAGHQQLGLVVAASVAAYQQGRIKKHELTRPAKETDRARHIATLGAQTGPALLAYRATPAIDQQLAALATQPAEVEAELEGVTHQLWSISDPAARTRLTDAFAALDALYIADGHHRSAAAARVASERAADRDPHGAGVSAADGFLAVAFPHDQLRILAYHRVVRDLGHLDAAAFLARVAERFALTASPTPVTPVAPGELGMYLDGSWYRLSCPPLAPGADAIAQLDVSRLQDQLIAPLLGIEDPRRDARIDFVGGSRGLAGLTARVDSGEMRVAFALYPTRMESLMAVADSGAVMPPKSTWFDPKLADGLVSLILD